jgi:hypothetical protein
LSLGLSCFGGLDVTDDDSENASGPPPTDPNALVQWVLRESYLQTTEDLRFYADKVRYFNKRKRTIRDYLNALRQLSTDVKSALREEGIDPCAGANIDPTAVAKAIQSHAHEFVVDPDVRDLCVPDHVPPSEVTSLQGVEDEIRKWEERLNTIGDDAQLANVDLQNILQKQQQTLQMMSNISKMLYDTATSVIRKMGG